MAVICYDVEDVLKCIKQHELVEKVSFVQHVKTQFFGNTGSYELCASSFCILINRVERNQIVLNLIFKNLHYIFMALFKGTLHSKLAL